MFLCFTIEVSQLNWLNMARSATVCHWGRVELWIGIFFCGRGRFEMQKADPILMPSTQLSHFLWLQKKKAWPKKGDWEVFKFKVLCFLWYATFEPQRTNQYFLHPFLPLKVRLLCRTVPSMEPFVEPSLKTLNLGDANCIFVVAVVGGPTRVVIFRCILGVYAKLHWFRLISSVHWSPFFASLSFVYKSKWELQLDGGRVDRK